MKVLFHRVEKSIHGKAAGAYLQGFVSGYLTASRLGNNFTVSLTDSGNCVTVELSGSVVASPSRLAADVLDAAGLRSCFATTIVGSGTAASRPGLRLVRG